MLKTARRVLPIAALLAAAAFGCGQSAHDESGTTEQRLDFLEAMVEDMMPRLSHLEQYHEAVFDPAATESFRRLETDVGALAVSIDNVEPYADGVRVRLKIGNLTTATINGGVINAKWGIRPPDSSGPGSLADKIKWKLTLSEAPIPFTDTLQPGTWNLVTVSLPGTPVAEFGYLELTLATRNISLRL